MQACKEEKEKKRIEARELGEGGEWGRERRERMEEKSLPLLSFPVWERRRRRKGKGECKRGGTLYPAAGCSRI